MTKIERIQEKLIYENPFLRFFDDEVQFPDQTKGNYVRIEWASSFCVGIVPIAKNGCCLLVNQFCYAANGYVIQIPKGFGKPNCSAQEVAADELREEIGGVAESWEPLLSCCVDPGLIASPMNVFLAQGVERITPKREKSEVIKEIVELQMNDLEQEISRYHITDPMTLAALFLARSRLKGD